MMAYFRRMSMEDQTDSGTPAKSRFMPFRYVSQSREIVRQFTPNWFTTLLAKHNISLQMEATI
jgi:hypothetical protein